MKAKAEERAAEAGQSLNTWLVNVVRAATRDGAINVDIDLSSLPFFGGGDPFEGGGRGRRGRQAHHRLDVTRTPPTTTHRGRHRAAPPAHHTLNTPPPGGTR